MKILIAEDTKDMNRVLTAALEHQGYQVDSAFDGEEASELIGMNDYDLMILDIMMPKKDGLQVLRDLRADHNTAPVLMLTAKTEVDDRVEGLDAGADDYLAKPFAMKELLARVRAMTRRRTEYQEVSGEENELVVFEDLSLNANTCALSCENSVRLSVREFDLLQFMIRNTGRQLDAKLLLDKIWRDSPDASLDTVQLYVMYLKGKLRAVSSGVEIRGELQTGFWLERRV